MTGKQVGIQFGAIRKGMRVSKTDLSRKAGVHRNTIARLEMGDMVSVETMACLATALGIRLSDVIREAEDYPVQAIVRQSASKVRSQLAQEYGLTQRQRRGLSVDRLIQLANCKDDAAQRLLLGRSA